MRQYEQLESFYNAWTFVSKKNYLIRLIFWIGLYYYNKEYHPHWNIKLWQYIKYAK
jgi:hypothetical protein